MYKLLYLRKKTLCVIIAICLIITTSLSVNIVNNQLNNSISLNQNLKIIYTLTFIAIVMLNLFNFIYIKIFLVIFHIKKNNLISIFYSSILMCLMVMMNPIELNIIIKLFIKIILFNLIFQEKEFEKDVFGISLIIGIIDLLMTLLLLWR